MKNLAPNVAIAAALRAQSRALDSLADALEEAPADMPSKYLDQHTSPLSKRVYLALARRQAFPTTRAGKRVLVERDAFDAWLTSQADRVPAAPASGARDVDAEVLSELGARAKRCGT